MKKPKVIKRKSKLNKKTSEVKAHSVFGGSQATRIKNCPGSVKLCEGLEGTENEASKNGTDAHACLEFIVNNRDKLKKRSTRQQVIDVALENPLWDEKMVDDALDALTYLKSQVLPKGEIFVEQKLDTSAFTTKNQSSTLDLAIANYSARELIIIDYKYGKYKVDVKKNDQLIYYALGMLIKLNGWKKFTRVRLVIIQPNSTGDTISEYYMTVDECIKWGKRFRKVVKIALKPNAPLKMGDKYCFFCLAKSFCPEFNNKYLMKEFDNIEE